MQGEQGAGSEIRHIETLWIPMRDGTRLAARLWLPLDAEAHPVPAVLEYIPYRRRDGTRDWDDLTHPYFAAQGYASVRLDMRGSGDSDGVLLDEYLLLEQQDAIDAIAWLAEQPWCSGRVGMIGISWGGFNGLQVAAHRPAALKAVISICSTDDRYADDMHFMGGCFTSGHLEWGATFFTIMARSPDPLIVGKRWQELWRQRLEASTPLYHDWMDHQRRDDFWRFASICEDFSAVQCPVMAVGGWADGYSNAVLRLLTGLSGSRQGIIGPWGHKYPHFGHPGPAIGFLQEAVRWWDHWLKDRDSGIMAEPMLRAYLEDPVVPDPRLTYRPGRWVAAPAWPDPGTVSRSFDLAPGRLGAKPAAGATVAVASPQTTGVAGGEWCPYGLGGLGPDLPAEQSVDDARSAVFDTEPLTEALSLLGAAELDLTVTVDQPVAQLAVRLCDVSPDGLSERVTYGVLNLTHRDSHAEPQPVEPGRPYRVRIKLNDIGYRFPAGHRIRLAISTAYWPIIWPSPKAVRASIACGDSRLTLPLLSASAAASAPSFEPVVTGPPLQYTVHREASAVRSVERDAATGEQVITMRRDDGDQTINDVGVRTSFVKVMRYRIRDDDPATASMETEFDARHSHDSWDMRVRTHSVWRCDAENFHLESRLEAFEGERQVFSRRWQRSVPRDLV